MDLRDSGRASLRASRVPVPARTEPRPPEYTFFDSQDHARSFSRNEGIAMTQILILASCVYLSMLAATIYFTRATTRRVLGALAGGVAVAVVGAGVEAFAHAQGWWRYTADDTPYGPVALYPALVMIFAFLAMIGWVVTRRFGWRGVAVFLAVLAVAGCAARLLDLRKTHGPYRLRAGDSARDHRRLPVGGTDCPGDRRDAVSQRPRPR